METLPNDTLYAALWQRLKQGEIILIQCTNKEPKTIKKALVNYKYLDNEFRIAANKRHDKYKLVFESVKGSNKVIRVKLKNVTNKTALINFR